MTNQPVVSAKAGMAAGGLLKKFVKTCLLKARKLFHKEGENGSFHLQFKIHARFKI